MWVGTLNGALHNLQAKTKDNDLLRAIGIAMDVGGQTIKQALRFASVRGTIVLLGCAAEIKKLDLTFVWANELRIQGYQCYGIEEWRGKTEHTFQITHDMLLETAAPVEDMVTHVFPLWEYRNALSTAANRRKTGAVKVLLDPHAS